MLVEDECNAVFLAFIWGPRKLNAMTKSTEQVWVGHTVAFENWELLTVLKMGPVQPHDWKNQRLIERGMTWQCSASVFISKASISICHRMTYWGGIEIPCNTMNNCLWILGSRWLRWSVYEDFKMVLIPNFIYQCGRLAHANFSLRYD